MKILKGVALLFYFINSIFSQVDSNNLVKYTPDFKFTEGIYLSFEQVRSNSPIPKSRIISICEYDDPDFFIKVLSKNKVFYYDNIGNRNEFLSDKVWGYSRNGFLYIRIEEEFYRITLIGSICHFVANHTTYSNYYNNPYYYNSYMDPSRFASSSYPSTELRQYILDFSSGRVFDYSIDGIELILMQDPLLHDEFMALSKKKKKQLKFVYIRKFNEKNPLYFPKNKIL
jgi:hypothetical protein